MKSIDYKNRFNDSNEDIKRYDVWKNYLYIYIYEVYFLCLYDIVLSFQSNRQSWYLIIGYHCLEIEKIMIIIITVLIILTFSPINTEHTMNAHISVYINIYSWTITLFFVIRWSALWCVIFHSIHTHTHTQIPYHMFSGECRPAKNNKCVLRKKKKLTTKTTHIAKHSRWFDLLIPRFEKVCVARRWLSCGITHLPEAAGHRMIDACCLWLPDKHTESTVDSLAKIIKKKTRNKQQLLLSSSLSLCYYLIFLRIPYAELQMPGLFFFLLIFDFFSLFFKSNRMKWKTFLIAT